MERKEVFSKLNEIFEDVLDLDGVELTDESCAEEFEEWGSIENIQLLVSIEKAFNVKFPSAEVLTWKNVGNMVDSILEKCQG